MKTTLTKKELVRQRPWRTGYNVGVSACEVNAAAERELLALAGARAWAGAGASHD